MKTLQKLWAIWKWDRGTIKMLGDLYRRNATEEERKEAMKQRTNDPRRPKL